MEVQNACSRIVFLCAMSHRRKILSKMKGKNEGEDIGSAKKGRCIPNCKHNFHIDTSVLVAHLLLLDMVLCASFGGDNLQLALVES